MNEEVESKRMELCMELADIYESNRHLDLSPYATGILAGIQQTVLWLEDPARWMHPLDTVPRLQRDVKP